MLQRQAADEKKDDTAQAKATADTTPEVAPNLESRIQTQRGGGQPLADSTRTFFESRFGYDFGGVRVHTDSQAAETASHLNAQAFTIGRDVFFGAGRYEPHTSGQWLLAHELTHTLQQNPTQPLAAKRKIVQPQSEGGHGHPRLRLQKNGAIAYGATGVAAKFVEDALGKAVPVVISFLAALPRCNWYQQEDSRSY